MARLGIRLEFSIATYVHMANRLTACFFHRAGGSDMANLPKKCANAMISEEEKNKDVSLRRYRNLFWPIHQSRRFDQFTTVSNCELFSLY